MGAWRVKMNQYYLTTTACNFRHYRFTFCGSAACNAQCLQKEVTTGTEYMLLQNTAIFSMLVHLDEFESSRNEIFSIALPFRVLLLQR